MFEKKIQSIMLIIVIFTFIFAFITPIGAHILVIGDSKSDYLQSYTETSALANVLKSNGYEVLELYRSNATAKNILKGMYNADAIIYAGHGGYQSGNYDMNGGSAIPPFALTGSDDFVWGIGDQMRVGWNGNLVTAPFKQNIPVFLLHTCFSNGWVGDGEIANPIQTIYNFASMFTGAGANYYATAWNGAEIVYDFLNGAKDFADANNKNNEIIIKSTQYNGDQIWRNDHGYSAFVGNWSGKFPNATETTAYDSQAAEIWYNTNCVKDSDLRIDNLYSDGNANTGRTGYSINSLVKNYGKPTNKTFYVSYYLSADTVRNTNDIYIGHTSISISDGETSSYAPASCNIPLNVTQGHYYLIANADSTGIIPESNEANNAKTSASKIFVWRPDLSVETVSPSGNTATGITNYVVNSTVKNGGSVTSNTFYVSYYLSTDPYKSSNDRYIGHATINGLNGWSSTIASANCAIPKDTAQGNYYIVAVTDSTGIVPESYENNNIKSSASRIFIWRPDLGVETVSHNGSTVAGKTGYSVNSNIKNYGSLISGDFYVSYYLSADTARNSNDIYIGHATINGLSGWTSTSAPASCNIPGNIAAGYYYLISSADSTIAVSESNEANNIKTSVTKIYIQK